MNKKKILLAVLIFLLISLFVILLISAKNENQIWGILIFFGIPGLALLIFLISKIQNEGNFILRKN